MNSESLDSKARRYLIELCQKIPSRRVGSQGNRDATAFFKNVVEQFNFKVETQPFQCLDMRQGEIKLSAGGRDFEAFISPYTLACDVSAGLAVVSTVDELEAADVNGKILLLRGEIAKEQLMPKNFVFYNPEEHQRIYRLLEEKQPAAIISATSRNPELAGAVYPFPMFEDGDFNIPSQDRVRGRLGGAAERFEQFLRAQAGLAEEARIRGEPPQPVRELLLPRDPDQGVPGQERVGDLPEILHVRADDRRHAVPRRLEDVVPPLRNEAASDEREVGRGVRARKLAHRVEQQDRFREMLRPLGDRRAAHHGNALAADQGLDRVEPLRVARREEEPDRRVPLPRGEERPQELRLLAVVRRSGDDPRGARGLLPQEQAGKRRRPGFGGETSNFRFPPTVTISRGAPSAANRSASSAVWAEIVRSVRRMGAKNHRNRMYPANERFDNRPLTITTGIPRRAHAAMKLGQISVSTITTTSGRTRSRNRPQSPGRSNGK